jgi:predicted MFS family arabinose efflux permease
MKKERIFTQYEAFVIAILAILQFTIILDFMVLSPLGAILMPVLHINTAQFGFVVSAYAFSAGASGLLAAGFADRFDRKKFLLFFYVGFLIGTLFCAMAPNYHFLLMARIVTGIFGGVIGSVCFAIITDMFRMEVRGRVMGFVQMAFGASQILGLPIGLMLANRFGWHSPFWMIVGFGVIVGIVIFVYLKPVDAHLKLQTKQNAFLHLSKTVVKPLYVRAFLSTVLLSTGGFMLIPFGSTFGINNLGLKLTQLPALYLVTGIFAIVCGPIIGRYTDKVGKFRMFLAGTILSMTMVGIYTNMGITPLGVCIFLNVLLFIGINTRMIAATALTSAVPSPQDRGAFMSVNSSIQQISGGVATFVAGLIVVQKDANSRLENYDLLGGVVMISMLIALGMLYWLDTYMKKNKATV